MYETLFLNWVDLQIFFHNRFPFEIHEFMSRVQMTGIFFRGNLLVYHLYLPKALLNHSLYNSTLLSDQSGLLANKWYAKSYRF